MKKKVVIVTYLTLLTATSVFSQERSKFKQLDEELPTPNEYRTASGAPGYKYWQQRADYVISAELNDAKQSISGTETITYHNNSPDELAYLWLQLDQNIYDKNSDAYKTSTEKISSSLPFDQVTRKMSTGFDGGFKIASVKTESGQPLKHTINKTMMRVDLPQSLKPGAKFTFSIQWSYNITNQRKLGGRSGFEYFEKDSNYLYEIAQWFPRMCVYNDINGWQHKQFLGRGEFTLPFGDYKVSLTVPADHVVGATGDLMNAKQVLSATQLERLGKAGKADEPMLVITQAEAEQNEKSRSREKKTWVFHAKNVRDFAWCSSRKFIWDAQGVNIAGNHVMAMSYYPKEGNPLWGKYSTALIVHTLKVYSKYSINYPYPVAISVNGPVGGMEYPMICFNGPRPEADGTYSERTKNALILVIIHEVGHNFFPMIINSDERQWTWMDEGLNTFLQYIAEQEWDRDFPSSRGPARHIVDYMKSEKNVLEPIMTNSESLHQFGNNAYAKTATAINILRETVMGRELFDFAFKEYARRWAFRHPSPADFFRTMEDASAVDLDWFWHGWFYTTDNVDISIERVAHYRIDTQNPEVENPKQKTEKEKQDPDIGVIRNKTDVPKTAVEENPKLTDFYHTYDPLAITVNGKERYTKYYNSLSEEEKKVLGSNLNFYEIEFKNIGGLVMPLLLEFEFEDGTIVSEKIPAEIWRLNSKEITKVFMFEKIVKNITLDPYQETADVDMENNFYPRKIIPSRFQLYKQGRQPQKNPMQLNREGKN